MDNKKEPDFRLTLDSRGSFLSSQAVSHQLLSALRSLTAVFGMGTGVSFLPLPPHSLLELARSKLNIFYQVKTFIALLFWSSPRLISTGPLQASRLFHSRPIYLIVSEVSYFLEEMGNLILRGASHLDAFSAYPVRT